MTDIDGEIEAVLNSDEHVPRDRVMAWIDGARDLSTLRLLYRLTDVGWSRIHPELDPLVVGRVIHTFLLECIRLDPHGDNDEWGRYEAARTMVTWFYHLTEMPPDEYNPKILEAAAAAVTTTYLSGNDDVRECIETGFMEHLLEVKGLRPLFAHWQANPVLKPAHDRALEWGKAHPNFMRGLNEYLRHAREISNGDE